MSKTKLFTQVPKPRVSRNLFDLSHEVKMSAKFGRLYPVLCMDVLPGDVIRDQMSVFARFAPMLAPIMHRVDVTTHFFFVPNRIICDQWEDFITGGQDGDLAPVLPYATPFELNALQPSKAPAQMGVGSLWDYLGYPTVDGASLPANVSTEQFSVLPFKAFVKIWNDYYRDPNLDNERDLDTEVEGDNSAWLSDTLDADFIRGWEKDYFTSALPWAQRGPQVLLPLAGTGSVEYLPTSLVKNSAGAPSDLGALETNGGEFKIPITGGTKDGRIENIESVQIDASEVTMNDFRRSLAIQRWLENNARGGGRYIEQIESHFDQRVPDFRLQRAEYLGGGKQPVQISEVLSTADTEDVPVGDMAGHGMSVGKTNRFTYRCQEHGWIIGIISVMPRTAYSQGVPKMFTRKDKFEFAFPELAHLGEQEILSKEVFYSFGSTEDPQNNDIFGYIPRYSEYKFMNDRIAGDFKTTLSFWHLGRFFLERPVLDANFTSMLEDGTLNGLPLEESFRRIFAVQNNTDYIWMQLFHKLTAKRPLPYFGVPTLMG